MSSDTIRMVKDVSIIGAVVVVIVIVMIAATVYYVIGFLRHVVEPNNSGLVGGCASQIQTMSSNYQTKMNPATNANYTACEAAVLAVDNAATSSSSCPRVAASRPPYSVYVAEQCRPPPID
jgi:hypothetical protein